MGAENSPVARLQTSSQDSGEAKWKLKKRWCRLLEGTGAETERSRRRKQISSDPK